MGSGWTVGDEGMLPITYLAAGGGVQALRR
jgi:hypothetical protein